MPWYVLLLYIQTITPLTTMSTSQCAPSTSALPIQPAPGPRASQSELIADWHYLDALRVQHAYTPPGDLPPELHDMERARRAMYAFSDYNRREREQGRGPPPPQEVDWEECEEEWCEDLDMDAEDPTFVQWAFLFFMVCTLRHPPYLHCLTSFVSPALPRTAGMRLPPIHPHRFHAPSIILHSLRRASYARGSADGHHRYRKKTSSVSSPPTSRTSQNLWINSIYPSQYETQSHPRDCLANSRFDCDELFHGVPTSSDGSSTAVSKARISPSCAQSRRRPTVLALPSHHGRVLYIFASLVSLPLRFDRHVLTHNLVLELLSDFIRHPIHCTLHHRILYIII